MESGRLSQRMCDAIDACAKRMEKVAEVLFAAHVRAGGAFLPRAVFYRGGPALAVAIRSDGSQITIPAERLVEVLRNA